MTRLIGVLVLVMVLSTGCATNTGNVDGAISGGSYTGQHSQERAGMKRITSVLGTDSFERQIAQVIEGWGYPCPTVVEFGEATVPKGASLVAKAECSNGSRYRVEFSEDKSWVKVDPIAEPLVDSFERGLQRVIEGNGFKCSRATDTYEITRGKLFKVMCPEGAYKLTGNAASGFTVTQW